MTFRHLRLALLAAVSAGLALAGLIPGAASAAHKATVISVTAGKPSEFHFTLSASSVKHGAVVFKLVDKGALPHDFKLCSSNKGTTKANACTGKVTPLISPGGSATLSVTLAKAGTYEYLCTVPGHAAGGMKGVLRAT